MAADDGAGLLSRARDELHHAKTLVRSIRNSTKTVAAALQDSEDRIDLLIAEIEEPHAQGGPGSNGKDTRHHIASR